MAALTWSMLYEQPHRRRWRDAHLAPPLFVLLQRSAGTRTARPVGRKSLSGHRQRRAGDPLPGTPRAMRRNQDHPLTDAGEQLRRTQRTV